MINYLSEGEGGMQRGRKRVEAWHFLEANLEALVPFSECEVALGLESRCQSKHTVT